MVALAIILKDMSWLACTFVLEILGHWRVMTIISIIIFLVLGSTVAPEFLIDDPSSLKSQENIRYAIKGTLVYGLGWIIILTVHEGYDTLDIAITTITCGS